MTGLWQGSTGSVSTGPYGARAGTYYKYIETSSPRLTGDNATLVSNKVFEGNTRWLRDSLKLEGVRR